MPKVPYSFHPYSRGSDGGSAGTVEIEMQFRQVQGNTYGIKRRTKMLDPPGYIAGCCSATVPTSSGPGSGVRVSLPLDLQCLFPAARRGSIFGNIFELIPHKLRSSRQASAVDRLPLYLFTRALPRRPLPTRLEQGYFRP